MKALSKQATGIFKKLTDGLKKPGDSKKIDNAQGLFMAVHVDFLWESKQGRIYSLSHYYEQNGDLMRDPDMEFLDTGEAILPMTYRQDGLGIHQTALLIGEDEQLRVNIKLQKQITTFANQWMKNIKDQQEL